MPVSAFFNDDGDGDGGDIIINKEWLYHSFYMPSTVLNI